MNNSKTLYIIVLVVAWLAFTFFEYGIFPTDLIPPSNEATYAIDLASIVTAVGGCFALLYTFRFSMTQKYLARNGESGIRKVNNLRLLLWLVLMLANVFFYYEARFCTNPKYSILILVIAVVFCWPSSSEQTNK